MTVHTDAKVSKSRSLLKSTSKVVSLTFLSRVLGFFRDVVNAHFFGASHMFDAFLVAFKIPNFLRRLFAEGAFAQAFVPVLSEYKETKSHQEVHEFVNRLSGTLAVVLLGVTLIAVLFAPLVIMMFAPGFAHDGSRYLMASHLLRITFPYLLLVSLTAFAGSILNCYGQYGIPAFTPVLLNISLIGAAIFFAPYFKAPVESLAWGVFIAGIAQLVFQLPFLYKLRLLPKLKIAFGDPGVRRVMKLMMPALFGVSVSQLSLLIDTIFASFLKVGSVSWLFYSERLMEFPLGIFGVATATVIMPYLSRSFVRQDHNNYTDIMDWALRCILVIGFPSAIGLVLLAGPLLATLFHYGHYTNYDVEMTRLSLIAMSLGIPAYMLIKVLASAFYARQNIRTPVRIAVISLFTNMVLNFLLIHALQHAGLALATTLSACLNAALLFQQLYVQGIYPTQYNWVHFLLRLLIANLALVVVLYVFSSPLDMWLAWSWQTRCINLAELIVVGVLVYIASLYCVGLRFQHFRAAYTNM